MDDFEDARLRRLKGLKFQEDYDRLIAEHRADMDAPDREERGAHPLVVHVMRAPTFGAYCGRPSRHALERCRAVGAEYLTQFGNPFVIGTHGTRYEVIQKFVRHLARSPLLMQHLRFVKGKIVACWCAPHGCHCNPIVRLANGETTIEQELEGW